MLTKHEGGMSRMMSQLQHALAKELKGLEMHSLVFEAEPHSARNAMTIFHSPGGVETFCLLAYSPLMSKNLFKGWP